MSSLHPHDRPPEPLRLVFKRFQKLTVEELENAPDVADIQTNSWRDVFSNGLPLDMSSSLDLQQLPVGLRSFNGVALEARRIPGLHIVPEYFSPKTQLWLLDRLLHRDLVDNRHLTNLHKHYNVDYDHCEPTVATTHEPDSLDGDVTQRSFFNVPPDSRVAFEPLDSTVHKPLTVSEALRRKLRWITLGGQYDWTEKKYPKAPAPQFPEDVANLVRSAFPVIQPEAAIVNVYSPGDTLSLHRDVSEESDQGLVSISIGCECLFVVGIEQDGVVEHLTLRLRSGDALLMAGKARYAWHGVPRIFSDSCPSNLASWPASEKAGGGESSHEEETADPFTHWRGWLAGKRINLNVRQMRD